MIIKDLEKFALSQIFRPYQTMLEPFEGLDLRGEQKTLTRLPMPLEEIPEFAEQNKEWRDLVLGRIEKCDFKFATYICHPLVDYLKSKTPATE